MDHPARIRVRDPAEGHCGAGPALMNWEKGARTKDQARNPRTPAAAEAAPSQRRADNEHEATSATRGNQRLNQWRSSGAGVWLPLKVVSGGALNRWRAVEPGPPPV
ncbi:hypothetical protein GCM10010174_52900 [Kutzneria viridogrisea]